MSNHSVKTEIMTITPAWAEEKIKEHNKRILDGTFRQRALDDRTVRKYSADMKNGNWLLNGHAIQWDQEGNLIDGQHRLWAIRHARVPVQMLIMTGLPVRGSTGNKIRTMDTQDIGRPRNFQMQLRIEGVQMAVRKSAAVRLIGVLCAGTMDRRISPPQSWAIYNFLEKHIETVIEGLIAGNQQYNARSYIIAPLALLRCVEPDAADLFVKDYTELSNLKINSPVLTLRKWFDRPHSHHGYEMQRISLQVCCTALWYYVNEKPVLYLKGDRDHVEWLLKLAKNQVKKIQEMIGEELTIEKLQA